MAEIIVVTSGKGGVGKTTTSASIASGLARREKRVAVIDFDIGLRNLDLIMGCERRVVYDFVNVIQGRLHTQASADQGQAPRQSSRARRLANPRQGRANRRGCAPRARRADRRRFRLHHLRFARRYRERCASCDVFCRSSGRGRQPRGFFGTRFRSYPGLALEQDETRRGKAMVKSSSICCLPVTTRRVWPRVKC